MPGEASTVEVLVWLIRPLLLAYCWYLGAARFVSLAKSMGMNPEQEREMKREAWRVLLIVLAAGWLNLIHEWCFGRPKPFPEFFEHPPVLYLMFIMGQFLLPLLLMVGVWGLRPWANSSKVASRLQYWPIAAFVSIGIA